MRHTYELTTETIKVFSGNVGTIAEEAEVSDKYIHAILAGTETDPFSPFQHYYAAAVRAKAPVLHYKNKLAAIEARYQNLGPRMSEVEYLADKIKTDATTTAEMVEALSDGKIDAREAGKILIAIQAERRILDKIERMLNGKQGALLEAV